MYHNIIPEVPATGVLWIFKNLSCSTRTGSEFVVVITRKSLQNQLWMEKWKACQVSYFPFLFMVFFRGLTHSFWMPGENRRSRKRESDVTSNGRSSSSNLMLHLQTNPITISPVHSLDLRAFTQVPHFVPANASLKIAFITKTAKDFSISTPQVVMTVEA